MRIINKIKATTTPKNRFHGKISTILGTTCVTVLSLGVVTNPIGITALSIGATLFLGKAGHHALKTR